jgi:hypothetical protein
VAHACNPSYSGGRDQEHHGSKPAQANSSQGPILKIPITKKGWYFTQGEGPEFKPQYCKKKKKVIRWAHKEVTNVWFLLLMKDLAMYWLKTDICRYFC